MGFKPGYLELCDRWFGDMESHKSEFSKRLLPALAVTCHGNPKLGQRVWENEGCDNIHISIIVF